MEGVETLAGRGEMVSQALDRWLRGRPGTSGVVVLCLVSAWVVAVAFGMRFAHQADGSLTFASRAKVGLLSLAMAGVLLGAFRVRVAFVRRRRGPAAAERSARTLAGPRWRCSWQWPVVGAGAAALMFLAWLGLDPVLQRLSSVPPGTMNALPDRSAAMVLAAGIAWLCSAVMEELVSGAGCNRGLGDASRPW